MILQKFYKTFAFSLVKYLEKLHLNRKKFTKFNLLCFGRINIFNHLLIRLKSDWISIKTTTSLILTRTRKLNYSFLFVFLIRYYQLFL